MEVRGMDGVMQHLPPPFLRMHMIYSVPNKYMTVPGAEQYRGCKFTNTV